jgi:hypothetical protein
MCLVTFFQSEVHSKTLNLKVAGDNLKVAGDFKLSSRACTHGFWAISWQSARAPVRVPDQVSAFLLSNPVKAWVE